MRYLSLFSGIGGFERGIEQAYDTKNHRKKLKKGDQAVRDRHDAPDKLVSQSVPVCIGYSEIDKYAIQIYQKHYPTHKNYGDITTIEEKTLPNFDLLVGGFPCQSFSIAGKRQGFKDTRGTLFFHIERILREKKPRLLLLENVKGLLSHDKGNTFRTIISTLTDVGYDLQWQVLNSKDFGVPQNRERVIIVGHLRGTHRPEVFPFGFGDSVDGEVREEQNKERARSSCLSTRYGQRWTDETYIGTYRTQKDGQGFRETKSGLASTIQARAREDGSGQPVIMQRGRGKNKGGAHSVAPTLTGRSYQDNNHVFVGDILEKKASYPSFDHDTDEWDYSDMKIRRLTPVECERLQGFPDKWTETGIQCSAECKCMNLPDEPIHGSHLDSCYKTISDTQRYKCLGNAVTVNVIEAVISKMI